MLNNQYLLHMCKIEFLKEKLINMNKMQMEFECLLLFATF